jgi:FkbM family methyltransferase
MLWCNPHFYKADEDVLRKFLRPGDVFVDVGANIGALSLTGSRIVGETGRVFSVEAHPQTVTYLRGNIELNNAKNVTVIHAAAGDHKGTVNFSSGRSDDQNRVTETGISVPLRTLDSLLPGISVRLLKIDVEGFELFALRGAARILQCTDIVYFESWEAHFRKYGYSTPDLLALLWRHGFEIAQPPDYRSLHCENLLAVRLPT